MSTSNLVSLLGGVGILVTLLIAIWLWAAYRKNREDLVKNFAIFFSIKFPALVFLSALPPLLAASSPQWSLLSAIGGEFLLDISLAPLVVIFSSLIWPQGRKYILAVIYMGAALFTMYSLVDLIAPGPLVFKTMTAPALAHSLYMFVSHLIFMTGFGVFFCYRGFRDYDARIRARSIILGAGLISASLSGYMISFIPEYIVGLLIINAIGHLMMLWGVLYKVERRD